MLLTLRCLWPWLQPHRVVLLSGSLWILLSDLLLLSLPLLLRQAIAAIEQHDWNQVRFCAALMVLATLLGALSRVQSRLQILGCGRRVEVDLRRQLFGRLLDAPAPFFDRLGTGDLISRLTNDLTQVRMVAGFGLVSLINALVVYSLTLTAMLWLAPLLSLLALLPFVLLLWAVKRISRQVLHYSARTQEQLGGLSDRVDEAFNGQRSLRSAGFEPLVQRQFDAANAAYLADAEALARSRSLLVPLMSLVTPVGLLLVLFVGGRQVIAGSLQLGDLVAFNAFLVQLAMPTLMLGWILTLFQRAATAFERLDLVLQLPAAAARPPEPPAPVPPCGAPAAQAPESRSGPTLRLQGLRFAYEPQHMAVLGPLDLTIASGQCVALVGPVACGKTSLLRLLTGRYPLPPGMLFIDGRDIGSLDLENYRRRLSVVLQEGQLFSGSLAQNLAFAAPATPAEQLDELVRQVCLDEDLTRLPAGLASRVGEGGLTLSGGQRQRVALGRALLRRGDLWLLDDPFSHLDGATADRLWRQLRPQLAGCTVVLALSRVRLACQADWVICLKQGRVREQGTPAALQHSGGDFARRLRQEQLAEELGTNDASSLSRQGGEVADGR
ncbi:MAG: ABC transporter ATP-binding protein [Desulfuromonas thiophila]|nr:ABC transporter ATP-binding protein [Desulfuromonas thiophila]